jgi:hypothetical protein
MIRKFILTLLAAAGSLLPIQAQQTKLLTAEKFSDYGLVYTLPNTALAIDVQARHTVRRAGPYYLYAKKQIGAANAISSDDERWEVTGVTVRPFGVANDSATYKMQVKATMPTYICVASDGMLLSVNTKAEEETLPQPAADTPALSLPTCTEYLQYVGEDFLSSQSSAMRAQMLAESLMEVREARLSLTRGTAETMPTDGRQLELMLNSLKDQEQTMVDAFCGVEGSETRTMRFEFLPDEDGRFVIARLSDFSGFVDPEDLSGAPITISVETIRQGEVPLDDKGQPRQQPKDGVAYVIPGTAAITIAWEGKTLFSGEIDLAQAGTVFTLDPAIFTAKKSPSFAIFDPATGAVREIGTMAQ